MKVVMAGALAAVVALATAGIARAHAGDTTTSILPTSRVISTDPGNGDQNPYGVAFVPQGFPTGGPLQPGDILVSNFNNSANLQGTGTTIVRITPDGQQTLFFPGTPPLGLTTALAILKAGFIVVGNFPSSDGTCENSQPGSLLLIDAQGNLVTSLTHPDIAGPWDMTVDDDGNRVTLFVSNALTGKVVRFQLHLGSNPKLTDATTVASGYVFRCDPTAFVVSPTGLVLDEKKDILYVASTGDNAIYAVDRALQRNNSAGLGQLIFTDPHLHGPNALVLGPAGHFICGNADVINSDPANPSMYTEFTVDGKFVTQLSVDPAQGGSFGLAIERRGDDFVRLALVNDNVGNLIVYSMLPAPEQSWHRR